jgi:hypothetical protein
VLVPYNEPDGNWFGGLATNATTRAAFVSEWLETYNFLKQLWPQARIAGPNFFQYQPAALSDFLTFCKANGCLPDVITWHELVNPATVAPAVAAFRQLEMPSCSSRIWFQTQLMCTMGLCGKSPHLSLNKYIY